MKHVVIATLPTDVHADAVTWAVRQLGGVCHRWLSYDVDRCPASAFIGSGAKTTETKLIGPDGEFVLETADTLWLRRITLPPLPKTMLPSDKVVASRQLDNFLRGMMAVLDPKVFLVNPPHIQRRADFKLAQLRAAQQVGLAFPETMMSNSIDAVRHFVATASERVIYKPFTPAVWEKDEKRHAASTVFVDLQQLSDSESLRFCPGIFQVFVPKAYELRVMIFGRTCIAAKITEQDELDYRFTYQMELSPYQLPLSVEARLFGLMDQLGLAMGIADLIVTPQGEYVFLEVNEQGQFLWVEQMCPEIRILEPFARFLLSGDVGFRSVAEGEGLTFGAYRQSDVAKHFVEESAQYNQGADPLVQFE